MTRLVLLVWLLAGCATTDERLEIEAESCEMLLLRLNLKGKEATAPSGIPPPI